MAQPGMVTRLRTNARVRRSRMMRRVRDVEKKNPGTTEIVERGWWGERTPLEKVGVVALGIAAGAVAAALVFPHTAAAAGGGALTATGGWLLKKAFGK